MAMPSKYKPEYAEKVLELGKQGMSECEMAATLDVPRSTMRSWKAPEWLEAFDRARELAQGWWEEQARHGLGKREFNSHLWLKVMASRYRQDYSERVINEHVGKDGAPLPAQMDTRELDRRIKQLLDKERQANSPATQPKADKDEEKRAKLH